MSSYGKRPRIGRRDPSVAISRDFGLGEGVSAAQPTSDAILHYDVLLYSMGGPPYDVSTKLVRRNAAGVVTVSLHFWTTRRALEFPLSAGQPRVDAPSAIGVHRA